MVTGGGSGLGFSIAKALVQSGASVLIAARGEDRLKEAVRRLEAESGPGDLSYTVADLLDNNSVQALIDHALSKLGGVDIFVGNSAYEHLQQIDVVEADVAADLYQVNTISNMLLVKGFLPHMRKQKWGRIIAIASIASLLGTAPEGTGAYGASKGALASYARVAAAEAGRDGITVNTIHPSMFMTDMMQGIVDKADEAVRQYLLHGFTDNCALGRWGDPEEIGGIIQLLASDAGSFITGTDISLDGGHAIMMKPYTVVT